MCVHAPNLDVPGDLEIRQDLASADDLEIRYRRRVKQRRLCTRCDLVVVRRQKPTFNLDDHQ